MRKEDFINSVLEQVRCKSVHEPLREELEAHIDDQAEAFEAVGLPREECEEEAVKTMGNAVDIGLKLDTAHRPHFPFAATISAVILMLCGVFLRYSLSRIFPGIYFDSHDILAVTAGVICFIVFTCIDYTIFARLTKKAYPVGAAVLSVLIIAMYYASILYYSGCQSRIISFFAVRPRGLTAFYGCILLLPLMCGFVYLMQGKKFGGFILSFFALSVPAVPAVFHGTSLAALIMNSLTVVMIMTFAVREGYFRVNKRWAYLILYIPAFIMISGAVIIKLIRNKMHYGEWLSSQKYVLSFISNAVSVGQGSIDTAAAYFVDDSYLLTGVIWHYGIIAGTLVAAALIAFPMILYRLSRKVRRGFGKLLVSAVIFVFAVQTLWYIGTNIGLFSIFASYSAAPFFNKSVTAYAAWGTLLGVFTSAYARADLLPERKKAMENIKVQGR